MTNIRLTYAEGSGDFVDNDFRRIGIIQDPYDYVLQPLLLQVLFVVLPLKLTGSGDYTIDEEIIKTVSGTAKGRVVFGIQPMVF